MPKGEKGASICIGAIYYCTETFVLILSYALNYFTIMKKTRSKFREVKLLSFEKKIFGLVLFNLSPKFTSIIIFTLSNESINWGRGWEKHSVLELTEL